MKIKKILAAVAATAVALSAMAVNAFAIDKGTYFDGGTLALITEDGTPQYAVDNNIDVTSIYGVRFNVTFNADEVADPAAWIGGGVGTNATSTGWAQNEWGRTEKPILADLENGNITWQTSSPLFTDSEAYAFLWIQIWGGTVEVNSVDILDANGNVIEGGAAPAADTTEAEAAPEATAAEEEAPAAPAAEEEVTAETPAADEAPAVVEAAPAADTTTSAAATGNVAVASIAAVMAVAGAAAVASRKRK